MQAAGYESGNGGEGEYSVTVDPELLRFLAKFPREQQSYLLRVLKGLDSGGKVEPAPRDRVAAKG